MQERNNVGFPFKCSFVDRNNTLWLLNLKAVMHNGVLKKSFICTVHLMGALGVVLGISFMKINRFQLDYQDLFQL